MTRFYALIALLIILVSNSNIHFPAFIQLTSSFEVTSQTIQLAFILNPFIAAISGLVYGTFIDLYGYQRVLIFSLSCFFIGTLICLISSQIEFFYVGRFFQSLGDAGSAIVIAVFMAYYRQGSSYARLQAFLGALMSGACAFAPLLGAVILNLYGWQGNYFLILISLIIVIPFIIFGNNEKYLENSLDISKQEKFDTVNSTLQNIIKKQKNKYSVFKNKTFFIFCLAQTIPLGIYTAFQINNPFIFMDIYRFSAQEYSWVNFLIILTNILGAIICMWLIKIASQQIALKTGAIIYFIYFSVEFIFCFFCPQISPIIFISISMIQSFALPFIMSTCSAKLLEVFNKNLGITLAFLALMRNASSSGLSFISSFNKQHMIFTLFIVTLISSFVALWMIMHTYYYSHLEKKIFKLKI